MQTNIIDMIKDIEFNELLRDLENDLHRRLRTIDLKVYFNKSAKWINKDLREKLDRGHEELEGAVIWETLILELSHNIYTINNK